ncbi:uncharacterized protein STEHIDRAFT_152266 [Stereum hirsutum FP-91666 SS1]|uniref:uncharacterized protein n=1 Tax=Stereum hirsutum (strain FP-91666) TaxID=721885 RepID=UPI000440AE13|nr:uncharacterized protein STEHIDRAFT_152266 [Stereum hirsutum FP-91666 SS1]EIM92975.1 hypothetical protein STEHIDRAFT_152266 [Stereum hirsutum FP-91666 SS1]
MDKADLETYQVQLSQVELALSADPENTELVSLRSELIELIDLTQTSLAQNAAASSAASSSHHKASEGSGSGSGSGSRKSGGGGGGGTGGGEKQVWSAGDECLAKYSGDGAWYPARINSVGGSAEKRMYSILFKGYNSTEMLESNALKPLPANYASTGPSSSKWGGGGGSKRKIDAVEEAERDKKRKKNEKKLEVRAAKAKEQTQKQASWQKFAKKSEKKGVHIAGVAGTSIFKTPDNPLGKVGVTGSGKGMTEYHSKNKHKFEATQEQP